MEKQLTNLRELPFVLFASVQEVARLPDAEVNVAAVGALHEVSGVEASGRDTVLADAALTPVSLVLQQLVQEHLGPILAEVVLVLNLRAEGESAIGAAKSSNFFDLLITFALALKDKVTCQIYACNNSLFHKLTLLGRHSKKKVAISNGKLATSLSWQRHLSISPTGQRSITAANSMGRESRTTVGESLQ